MLNNANWKKTNRRKKALLISTILAASLSLTAGCGSLSSSDKLIDNPNDSKQMGSNIEQVSSTKQPINNGLNTAVYDGLDKYLNSLSKDGKHKIDTLTLNGTLDDSQPKQISKKAPAIVKKMVYHDIKIAYSTGSITNAGLSLAIVPALSEHPAKSADAEKKELKYIDFNFETKEENHIKNDFFYFVAPNSDKLSPEVHFDTRQAGMLGRNPAASGDVICEKVEDGIQITYMVNGKQEFSYLIKGDFYGLKPEATSRGIKAIVDVYQ